MYSVKGNDIKLTRGDTFIATLTLVRSDEPYTPAEGDSILFAVKSKLNPLKTKYIENTPLISKAISTETMILTLDPADTSSLPFGRYCYDIQVTYADGAVDTCINNAILDIVHFCGKLSVKQHVYLC